MKRVSKKRLDELIGLLSERDKAIITSIEKCHYLTSDQIRRLHYTDSVSKRAAAIAANRGLVKLHDYMLITSLERRIGGVRAGSGAKVWSLAEGGVRLLAMNDTDGAQHKQNFGTSLNFLKHTLAVSEAYIQLTELCRQHRLELLKTEIEPKCWRNYTGVDGKPAVMKPDMFAVTVNGKYEDHWFIEVDMNTESPVVVLDKCRRYARYYRSGIEQEQNGVFPLIVWLAFNENRRNKLRQYIADCRDMSEHSKTIFRVILPDEFEPLICNGKEDVL